MKHDCEKWMDEGRGCSICATLVRHSVEDAQKLQGYINATIAELEAENNELRKIIHSIKSWDIQQASEKGTIKLFLPKRIRTRMQKVLSR